MSKAQRAVLSFPPYPCLFQQSRGTIQSSQRAFTHFLTSKQCREYTSSPSATQQASIHQSSPDPSPQILHHLSPSADDYSRSLFVDKCTLTIQAGSGGNGCVAFLRDKHIADGPPNGGDGGIGGSVWIQAAKGHTSLYKLARRRTVKAGRGIGGQGASKGGSKGADALIQVPVGTVVREISRSDPSGNEDENGTEKMRLETGGDTLNFETLQGDGSSNGGSGGPAAAKREKWVYYPGAKTLADARVLMPPPPKPRRSTHAMMAPPAPIGLDLSDQMEKPMLLAAGGVGGLGNPHFATGEMPKPKFASKGEIGVKITLELELKLLADVGLVGLPNAGKSTLLRSVTNSRTRVGDWAFTTLSPSVGTVVLDDHKGRPTLTSRRDSDNGLSSDGDADNNNDGPRTNFTIADIPGLIQDAHLDKGLGLGFLRHIERARMLAFVVDLSAGDAVVALNNLWKEVGEYETLRSRELNAETESRVVEWRGFGGGGGGSSSSSLNSSTAARFGQQQQQQQQETKDLIIHPPPSPPSPLLSTNRPAQLEPLKSSPISSKPWFVVATKADIPTTTTTTNNNNNPGIDHDSATAALTTHQNFTNLHTHLRAVESGAVPHPSGRRNGWRRSIAVLPVSAIRGEGVQRIKEWVVGLLDCERR